VTHCRESADVLSRLVTEWDDAPRAEVERPAPGEAVTPVQTCELRHFVEPCLLLLLRERPDHGYELVERLRMLGLAEGDSAGIYRTLRSLEQRGMVRSVWRSSAAGPARRTYSLTAEGLSTLDVLTAEVRDTRRTLDAYLDRYSRFDRRDAVQG
jgi:PadR family transcriptional regulator PadR